MTSRGSLEAVAEYAELLDSAATRLLPQESIAHGDSRLTPALAYTIQDSLVDLRCQRGARVTGAKLGLTSTAKQRQMNVSEPIYGWLTDDMMIDVGQSLNCSDFIQPRGEPEIAFLLGRDLHGSEVGAAQVIAATEAVFPAIDVLDSRFAGYSFTLSDVIADNASAAGYLLAGQACDPRELDLRLVGCVLERNGELEATACGAAVLGHPAASVAWLIRELARRGRGMSAGQIVLSGALTHAVPLEPGDVLTAHFDRLGTVELPCQ